MARPDVASRAAGGGRWRGRLAALAYLAAFALAIGVNLNPLYRSKPQQMAHDPLLSVSDSAADADAADADAGAGASHSPPPSLPLPPPFSPPLPPPFSPPPPSPPDFPPPVPLLSPPPSVSPPPPSPPLSPPPSVSPPPPSPLVSPPPLKEETAAAAAAAAAQAASQEPAAPALVTGAPPAPVVSAADAAADAEEGQESLQVGLTIVNTSTDPGAVCLDGSPPAFNWHPGRGTGRNKWILYLEGGAWCMDAAHCIDRSFSNFGSSTKMGDWRLQGLLSSSRTTNPDFFNWNLVYIRYCDGASFVGNVDEPIKDHLLPTTGDRPSPAPASASSPPSPHTQEGKPQIYMRGRRVFNSILSHLLAHLGMRSASCVALTPLCPFTLTGGQAANLHARDVGGSRHFLRDTMLRPVTAFHNVTLNPRCLASGPPNDSWQCFFPEHFLPFLHTPFFILNSLYDSWQIAHSYASYTLFLEEAWHACHMSLQGCDKEKLDKIHAYRDEMVAQVSPLLSSNHSAALVRRRLAGASSGTAVNGAYLISCRAHCMAMTPMWHGSTAPRIHNKTMAEAVGDWFFDRQSVALIDCKHPCNPTCT
ncbi:unnamed protein product [Closterium sp. Yama58-4]|nr:unnamed protein product [Closterium sp. Yama58-4]